MKLKKNLVQNVSSQLGKKKIAKFENTINNLQKQLKQNENEKTDISKEILKLKNDNEKLLKEYESLEV